MQEQNELGESWQNIRSCCKYCGDTIKKTSEYCSTECETKDSIWHKEESNYF